MAHTVLPARIFGQVADVLWALAQPVALIGLVAAFVVGFLTRRTVHYVLMNKALVSRQPVAHAGRATAFIDHSPWFRPARDGDVFGAVGAAVGGVGWGAAATSAVRARPTVVLAGPLSVLALAMAVFGIYRALSLPRLPLALLDGIDVLHGAPGQPSVQFLLSLAVGLLAFGLFALLPLPPLDGWTLLLHAVRRPGPGFAKARYWLEEQNIGVGILLGGLLLPLVAGTPLLLFLLNLVMTPVLRAWS